MSRENDTLTPKQARFVQEYLIDLNATQAAIRVGYSKKTATEQASRLLTNVALRPGEWVTFTYFQIGSSMHVRTLRRRYSSLRSP
jgi:hypothetical protein